MMKKCAEKASSLISAYIELAQQNFYDDAQIIDDLSGIFTRKDLEELGYGKSWAGESGTKAIYVKDYKKMAARIGIGELTLRDIVQELCKPGRDPRDEMPKPILRTDVLEMKDLKEGMILKGTVRNVIDFGAFVDIGVHQDGLVHISELTDKKFVKHPLEVVSVEIS